MESREFYFTDEHTELAANTGLDEISQKIKDCELIPGTEEESYCPYDSHRIKTDETDHDIRYFTETSREYAGMSSIEKAQVHKAYRLADYNSWRIIAGKSHAPQLDMDTEKTIESVACNNLDRLTLSGTGASGFVDFEPRIFDDYTARGFQTKLEFMQFAGAWLCNIVNRRFGSGPYVQIDEPDNTGVHRHISLGGDMHGDFRMGESIIPASGAINPLGQRIEYGPILNRTQVAGYHSTEKIIVEALCAYVIDDEWFTRKDKETLFETQLHKEAVDETPERGASFYADFGDDDNDTMMSRIDIDGMRLNAAEGVPYTQLRVHPTSETAALIVRKDGNGNIELKNNYIERGITFVPRDMLALFELFSRIGSAESRTSRSAILHSIQCAYDELKKDREPGYIILDKDFFKTK